MLQRMICYDKSHTFFHLFLPEAFGTKLRTKTLYPLLLSDSVNFKVKLLLLTKTKINAFSVQPSDIILV